jgi:hypothetical protein
MRGVSNGSRKVRGSIAVVYRDAGRCAPPNARRRQCPFVTNAHVASPNLDAICGALGPRRDLQRARISSDLLARIR